MLEDYKLVHEAFSRLLFLVIASIVLDVPQVTKHQEMIKCFIKVKQYAHEFRNFHTHAYNFDY